MRDLCAKCNVCAFMLEQTGDRWLSQTFGDGEKLVLIIDDCSSANEWEEGMLWAGELLGGVSFEYTSTVRCDYDPYDLTPEHQQEAVGKCAVWTNCLLERRAVILTTQTGLGQMKVGEEKENGSIFRSAMLGIVVVMPPLHTFDANLVVVYRPKVQRALKEVRLA